MEWASWYGGAALTVAGIVLLSVALYLIELIADTFDLDPGVLTSLLAIILIGALIGGGIGAAKKHFTFSKTTCTCPCPAEETR